MKIQKKTRNKTCVTIEQSNNGKRPFLHCRHTCDGCECTPIVGPRYHTAPDVDLCTKCYKNYTGKEINFVLEELERDRPYQDLWHEKWEKIKNPTTNYSNKESTTTTSQKETSQREILRLQLTNVIEQYEKESSSTCSNLDDHCSSERSATAV